MRITELTVGWSETVSLPDHCDVRPSVTYSATLEDGDVPEEVRKALLIAAKLAVQAEVDKALEEHNRPPKHYDGPRFQVMADERRKAVIIMTNSHDGWPKGFWHISFQGSRGLRFQVAEEKAEKYAKEKGWVAFDCTDGDFGKLPEPHDEEEPIPF